MYFHEFNHITKLLCIKKGTVHLALVAVKEADYDLEIQYVHDNSVHTP